jgi:hypothetical protein
MAYRSATLAIFLLGGTLFTVGCGEPDNSAARSENSRFELQHDKQGRLVRLDKTTGKVTVVDTSATRAESPTRRTREKQPTSSTPPPTTPSDAAASACGNQGLTKVSVVLSAAPVFIQPQRLPTPLVTLAIGTDLPVVKAEGDWYLIRFDDKRWGPRVGYIHCASVVATRTAESSAAKDRAATEKALLSPPATDVSASVERAPLIDHTESKSPTASPPQPKVRAERLNGYLEWRRPHYVIADGQRVHWDDHTQLTIGHYPDVQSVPLGYEIAVKGYRVADGSLVAEELQAKPNGIAAFENEMRNACDQVERSWIQAGVAFDQDRTGSIYEIGRIETSGPRVSRAESIIGRLLPPYGNPRSVRIYVVETRVWNASAMANGAFFVYSGLMDDMSDSELAVVLGVSGHLKPRKSGLSSTQYLRESDGQRRALQVLGGGCDHTDAR